jgi:carbon storage regulator
MLVLTRRVGDDVVIDHTIHVTVLEIHSNKVRLGITTPDGVGVLRAEIRDRLGAVAARPRCVESAR